MKEIEIKLPIQSDQAHRIMLLAEKTHIVDTTDTYYGGHKAGTLRIREDQFQSEMLGHPLSAFSTVVTCKGAKTVNPDGTTSREEIEVEVDVDGDDWRRIFSMLGFSVVAQVVKRRISFDIYGATVCIDFVRSLDNAVFIEIEVVTDSGDAAGASAIDRINSVVKYLGLEGIEPETRGYLDMVLERL